MNERSLPAEVVETDQRLARSADELMALRWHWTLDESNPDRISKSEYARQVGRDEATIRRDANAWAAWLEQESAGNGRELGTPQTPSDFKELSKLSGERQEAAKAIAAATGKTPANVSANRRDEVDAVLNRARNRAEERGTRVEDEIGRAAEWQTKARKTAERDRREKRDAHGMRYIEIEGHVGAAMQRLRRVLEIGEGVDFDADETDLIAEALGKLRALLSLIDLRITGTTDIDWDAELERMTK